MELFKTVVFALAIALGVRTFAFEPFNIPSGSMIPTLLVGDYLFVSKFSYGYSQYSFPLGLIPFSGRIMKDEPERGDVAVFRLPTDTKVDYIKRVIGLPGDTIQVKLGVLHINGEPVQRRRLDDYLVNPDSAARKKIPQYEETLPNGVKHTIIETAGDTGPYDNTRVYTVPDGHYFMMGDNRDGSQDSRFLNEVGFVPAENFVGRADRLFFSHDGSAEIWELWKWPFAVRYGRLLNGID